MEPTIEPAKQSTEPSVRHVVIQNSANPDSITLKRGAKGYVWEVKAYGNSEKDPQGIINRAMQMEADVRARVAVIENMPEPNITLEPTPTPEAETPVQPEG